LQLALNIYQNNTMMSTNMQKQQSEAIGILADRILGKFRKFEMLFVLVLMALLIARLMEIPGSSALLLAAMPFLSMMYFFHAFVASGDEQIDGIGRFVIRLASYSSAIGILGFVFMMYRYPGAEIMVSVGTIGIGITLPMVVMKWMKNKSSKIFNQRLIVRLAIILVISLILILLPDHLILESGLIQKPTTEAIE
jgi:hypothetical protein